MTVRIALIWIGLWLAAAVALEIVVERAPDRASTGYGR